MKFNWLYFIISFAIGMLVVYIRPTPQRIVIVQPTPSNIGETQFQDAAGSCHQYTAEKIECKGDESNIPVSNELLG